MTTEGSSRMNNDIQNQDDSSPLISLIDSINLTNLNEYYDHKTDILFKKRIDKLCAVQVETKEFCNEKI